MSLKQWFIDQYLSASTYLGENVLYPVAKGIGYTDDQLANPKSEGAPALFHQAADGGLEMTGKLQDGKVMEAVGVALKTEGTMAVQATKDVAAAGSKALGWDGMGWVGTLLWAGGGLLGGMLLGNAVGGGSSLISTVVGVMGAAGALWAGNAHAKGELSNLFNDAVASITGNTAEASPAAPRQPAVAFAPG